MVRDRRRKGQTKLISNIFWFMFGALTGVTTFVVIVCCIADGRYDRAEDEEMIKHEHTD